MGTRAVLALAALAGTVPAGDFLLGPLRLDAQEPPDSAIRNPAVLVGEVVDVESGVPVAGALITLEPLDEGPDPRSATADTAGIFQFRPVESGPYRVRIVRIGYRTLSDTVDLARDGETHLRAAMVPDAVDMEPVVVTAVRRRAAFLRDFERRRARGFGHFMDREEIEGRMAHATSDLFRMIPGVRVVRRRAAQGPLLAMRGSCEPQLYIDGISAGQQLSLDHMVRPDDIEAIEVYSSAGAPAQYASRTCGVILVWTRAAEPVPQQGSFWKRLLVVGGIFVGAFVLGR